jgi:hypothetical protein
MTIFRGHGWKKIGDTVADNCQGGREAELCGEA